MATYSGPVNSNVPHDLASLLLGRHPVTTYSAAAESLISGKRVLVTGAGGSIGSEIVRQTRGLDPAAVYLLDHDEGALHQLQLELSGHGLLTDPHVLLADIRDRTSLSRLLGGIRPDIVFHAAAHKHLPLLERFPAEGVRANVAGTRNVAAAAQNAGASLFVNVSTDKAAEPTSVLGATKRVAEDVAAVYASSGPRVASVRFGNVLGSRGSLLSSLRWQVEHGRDVTVTDALATRFFMTIPEAAALVIEASAMADSGETYVLDMGEPVSILGLVERYLSVTGRSNRIVFTGLRAGEKLDEVLVDNSTEGVVRTQHERISRIDRPLVQTELFRSDVDDLCESLDSISSEAVLQRLWSLARRIEIPLPRTSSDLELVS